MLFVIVNTLLPPILVVLLGAVLRGVGFLTDAFAVAFNRFIFWVSLPAFLFLSIQRSKFVDGSFRAAGVMLLASLAVAAISWFGARLFGISRRSRGAFCHCAFRGNTAYVGMPVISFAYAGAPQALQTEIGALAAIALAPCIILYNVLAVLVMTPDAMGAFDGSDGAAANVRIPFASILKGIAGNPLIIGCVLGSLALVLRQKAGVELPEFLARALDSVGKIAGPGALLALGASFTPERLRTAMFGAHVVALLKLLACPLIGYAFAQLLGVSPHARFVALVYLACPTAVASFVMAQSMKGDAVLAGGSVALTTVYSAISMAVVIALAGPA